MSVLRRAWRRWAGWSGEQRGAAACVAGVAVAGVFTVRGYLESGPDAWASLGEIGAALGVLAALAVVAAGVRAVRTVATTRPVVFHSHGAPLQVGIRHERGHRAAIERFGGVVTSCWVQTIPGRPDRISHGLTTCRMPRTMTPEQDAAISYAGGIAAGTQAGCGPDNAHARGVIARNHPWGDRGRAEREARAAARRVAGRGSSGRVEVR